LTILWQEAGLLLLQLIDIFCSLLKYCSLKQFRTFLWNSQNFKHLDFIASAETNSFQIPSNSGQTSYFLLDVDHGHCCYTEWCQRTEKQWVLWWKKIYCTVFIGSTELLQYFIKISITAQIWEFTLLWPTPKKNLFHNTIFLLISHRN
jgi:hypothetical protein